MTTCVDDATATLLHKGHGEHCVAGTEVAGGQAGARSMRESHAATRGLLLGYSSEEAACVLQEQLNTRRLRAN